MSEKTEQPGHIFQVMGAVVDVKFDSLDDLTHFTGTAGIDYL